MTPSPATPAARRAERTTLLCAAPFLLAGLLTVDPDSAIGFDIFTELKSGVAIGNTAYASLVVSGVTGLYRVDLLTGKATLVGEFPDEVIDIAIQLES